MKRNFFFPVQFLLSLPLAVGELEVITVLFVGVTVLLVSCDVVGAMVVASVACNVIVFLVMNCDDWTFVIPDEFWSAEDSGNPIVEFDWELEDNDEFHGVAKKLDKNGDVALGEILGLTAKRSQDRRR